MFLFVDFKSEEKPLSFSYGGRLFLYVFQNTKDNHADQVQKRKHFER